MTKREDNIWVEYLILIFKIKHRTKTKKAV